MTKARLAIWLIGAALVGGGAGILLWERVWVEYRNLPGVRFVTESDPDEYTNSVKARGRSAPGTLLVYEVTDSSGFTKTCAIHAMSTADSSATAMQCW